MKTRNPINLDAWIASGALDPMINNVGGPDLAAALASARTAQEALRAALSPELRALYVAASDAVHDAASLREAAVQHVAITHGLAIGAALAAFPEEPHDLLVDVGTRVAGMALGCDMDTARVQRLVTRVLGAVERAQG